MLRKQFAGTTFPLWHSGDGREGGGLPDSSPCPGFLRAPALFLFSTLSHHCHTLHPMGRGARKCQGSARYFQPRVATLKDHTPPCIHSPFQLGQRGRHKGREDKLFQKSRAGACLCWEQNYPTSLGAQHPTTTCPSFLCTHTHTHLTHRHICTRLPAHSAPARSPTPSHSCIFSLETLSRAQHRLLLCQDAPTRLWGWFCPCRCKAGVSPHPCSGPFVQQHARVSEQSTARLRAQQPWRSLERARWL